MGRINFEGENKREEAAGAGAGAEERKRGEQTKRKEKKRKGWDRQRPLENCSEILKTKRMNLANSKKAIK
jgi:hypothetical protein